MKKEDSLKPYDAKKSVWVPNKEDGGYDEGLIQVRMLINLIVFLINYQIDVSMQEIDGDKATVKVGWETKNFKADQLQQVGLNAADLIDHIEIEALLRTIH